MKNLLIGMLASVGLCMGLASCSGQPEYLGSWKAMSTDDVTPQFMESTSANSRLYLTFDNGVGDSDGKVTAANDYELMRPIAVADGASTLVFKVKGRAEVDGTWSTDIDDKDDLLLNLNASTMKVNLSESDITLEGSAPEGMNVSTVDSLKKVVAERVRLEMQGAMSRTASRLAVIKDVEVSKNDRQMGFELDNPDRDMRMERVSK